MGLIPGSGRSPGGGKATHSSILAGRIPWTEDPGGQQSVASHKVGYDWGRPSLVAQMIKNLPAMQETRVWPLGWEDPLEKGMATHSSILVWWILLTEEHDGPQSMGLQKVRHDWVTNILFISNFMQLLIWQKVQVCSLVLGSPPRYHLTQNRQEMFTRMLLGSGDII